MLSPRYRVTALPQDETADCSDCSIVPERNERSVRFRRLSRCCGSLLRFARDASPYIGQAWVFVATTYDTAVLVVRRGFGDAIESGASSADFGDDLVCGLMPDERFGVVVPTRGPHIDGFIERSDGVETRVAYSPIRELREPSLNQVQPRRRGRREMQVPTRTFRISEPITNRWCFVRGEIIEHNMHIEVLIDVKVDPFEKREDVDTRVGFERPMQDFACVNVQRREQISRAIAFIVVRHPFSRGRV